MATVTVSEVSVQTQLNLYRGLNNTPAGGTKVTISGWSQTNVPEINGRRVLDEDVTALLSPEQLQLFTDILDIAEQYLKDKWNIP